MSARTTTHLSAALLTHENDPLNFKHLATTLNLILEPTGLRFRVIHERAGMSAVLSCRRLHVSISLTDAALASADLQSLMASQKTALKEDVTQRLAEHRATIEISVGTGPLPHTVADRDPSSEALVPLLTQMVTNHLMNMNPARLVYWGETDTLMRPRDFLNMINSHAPDYAPQPPQATGADTPQEAPVRPLNRDEEEQVLLRQVLLSSGDDAPQEGSSPRSPSFLQAHLIKEPKAAPSEELTGHVASRFQSALRGPKAAFIVSFATILVAPIVGILLVVYNFMGGARLRPTALMACLAAAVTLAADLAQDYDGAETASAPVETSTAAQL